MTTTYTKPTVGGDDDAWGTILNTTIDAIATDMDARIAEIALRPVKLLSGEVTSIGDLSLALSGSYGAFRLELCNVTAGASQVFIRLDGITASNYDYVRTDVSAKSSGTVTQAAGISAAGILMTDTLKSSGTDSADKGFMTIDINTHANSTTAADLVKWTATYKNNDGSGYRVFTSGSGALLAQSARATSLKIGGFSAGAYTDGIRCAYALYGIPGIASS